MKKFLMIIKGEGPTADSPEQLQKALMDYKQWAGSLGSAYIDGQRLENVGVMLENQTKINTDGPFLASKEIIAGFVMLEAKDLDDAIQMAKNCPLIDHCMLEVRPVMALPG